MIQAVPEHLAAYRQPPSLRRAAAFWARAALETAGRSRLAPLIGLLLGSSQAEAAGLEHIPPAGSFLLAVNHFRGASTYELIAAVVHAACGPRPDLMTDLLLITGLRQRPRPGPHPCGYAWPTGCVTGS